MSRAADIKSSVFPFQNKGMVLKSDPAQLQAGEYALLNNVISTQEGTLNIRPGSQLLTQASVFGLNTAIHSITKLHGAIPADARYVGISNQIWRSTDPVPSAGAGMTFSVVASGVSPTCGLTDYPPVRWTGVQYNAGTTGKPYAYFACPGKGSGQAMVKDDSTFAALQNWGIVPPTTPPITTLDKITILPSSEVVAATLRVSTTISSVISGTAPGYVTVQPASMTDIVAGMEVTINSSYVIIVEETSQTTFSAYFPSTPSGGQTVGSGQSNSIPASTPTDFSATIDASFNGMASNGYATDDIVHIGVYVSDATLLTDFRFRVLVGSSTTDYYEKSILPSSIQQQISLSQTAIATLPTVATQVQQGVLGDTPIDLATAQTAKPSELDPLAPATAGWTEIDISKYDFTTVGQAGQAGFTWKEVTGFEVYFTGTATVKIGSVYIAGGFGPNSISTTSTTPLLPVDYAYCFRNALTGFESNPSILQVPTSALSPRRQAVQVTFTGTSDAQISTTAGDQSISIYRRGGAFSDGLFRHVGFATNPGGGSPATYLDTTEDSSLLYANILEFDNDPPVTSTLPQTIAAPIAAATTLVGGNQTTLTLTLPAGITDLRNVLTRGTLATIHIGNSATTVGNQEQVRLIDIPASNQITVYIQYNHFTGDAVEIAAITGQPCNLGCAAFDSIFLAGDVNSPHTLYKSKTGRPEAFPPVDLEVGISNQVNVGSPSNPIMAVTEFSGEVVTINLSNIYTIPVFAGAMQAPLQTPAQRGLVSQFAWCKADNEIWYLSYDGIYSWSGGMARLRSIKIDPLFKGATLAIGGITVYPIDTTQFKYCTMEYHDNEVFLVYVYTTGGVSSYLRLRYNTIFDRWSLDSQVDANGKLSAITAQYLERDSGVMLMGRSMQNLSAQIYSYLLQAEVGTTDNWTSAVTDGQAISYQIITADYNLALPSVDKQFADLMLDVINDTANFTISVFYNYSNTADVTDTFTIAATGSGTGRYRLFKSLQNGFGKSAFAFQLQLSGTNSPLTFYSLTLNYLALSQVQAGRAFDWDDLGYAHDKRLYQLQIEGDIPSGHTEDIVMDTITGVVGAQVVNQAVQTFTLSPPTGTFTGPTHIQVSFPIQDEVIAKKIRLRPAVASSFTFKLWGYSLDPFEKYPPDVTLFTEWLDFGTPYDKYAQQIVLDVNTNNVTGTVALYVDGGGSPAAGPFNVTTTADNRKVNLTVGPNIVGKMFRLVCTAGSGGKFQLFNPTTWLTWAQADPGPILHTTDFDYLGYPYDKELQELTINYDTSNTATTVLMDTMTGIKGETINLAAFSFVLDGPGRSLQTFSFPVSTYVKGFRIYPQSDTTAFKEWKYTMKALNMPADIVQFTDLSDLGWPCDKLFRSLELEMNTGGVDCTVTVQGDGNTLATFTVNTTINDRKRILTMPSDQLAKIVRLLFTAGSGGQAQYFNHTWDAIREPCAVTIWDSYNLAFQYDGYSFVKQMWLQYIGTSGLLVSVYVDGGSLLWAQSLPSHARRETERFYLPAASSGVLNKSKTHRIIVTSATAFKLYVEGSKIEWLPVGQDQRRGYQQMTFSAALAINTGYGSGLMVGGKA